MADEPILVKLADIKVEIGEIGWLLVAIAICAISLAIGSCEQSKSLDRIAAALEQQSRALESHPPAGEQE